MRSEHPAARDGEASRDPSPAELISFRYQTGSPAKPGQATKETTMHRNPPPPDQQRPGRLPASDPAATATPAPGSADLVPRRQLEKSVSWSGRERLRCLWYRLRLTIAEMNYANRRLLELQAPWISDNRPAANADTDIRNEH
jgi:hypothetical protein